MRLQHQDIDEPANLQSPAAAIEPAVLQHCEKSGFLVVDDDHMVRLMVQLGLERNGFEVWPASNGREAINLFRAHRENIAAVLLDVRMPGLDGPQTLDALRELDPEVHACFMSGDPGKYDPDTLVIRGAACFIAKPFLLDDLVHVLRLLTHGVFAVPLPFNRSDHGEFFENPAHGVANALDPCGR